MSLPTFKTWATSFWDYAIRGIIYEKYPPAPRKITAEWIKMAIRECAEIFHESFDRNPTIEERKIIMIALAEMRPETKAILEKAPPAHLRPN